MTVWMAVRDIAALGEKTGNGQGADKNWVSIEAAAVEMKCLDGVRAKYLHYSKDESMFAC
jgi:hypothetical protein